MTQSVNVITGNRRRKARRKRVVFNSKLSEGIKRKLSKKNSSPIPFKKLKSIKVGDIAKGVNCCEFCCSRLKDAIKEFNDVNVTKLGYKKKQNAILFSCIFTANGQFNYHTHCIMINFCVCYERISHLRENFNVFLRNQKVHHKSIGHVRRNKVTEFEMFLEFIDSIIKPTGRRPESAGRTFHLPERITSIKKSRSKIINNRFSSLEEEFNKILIDRLAHGLALKPSRFDVMVLPNLYGDIISDLCSGLIGGLGITGSGNIGNHVALFEAVHGTAPDIVGQNKANPTALLFSSLMMLKYLKLENYALKMEKAIHKTLNDRKFLTSDIGGTSSTTEYTDAIINNL